MCLPDGDWDRADTLVRPYRMRGGNMVPISGDRHRRSIRLPGYDYSSVGLYFVTICTQSNACLLGRVEDCEVHINPVGEMAVEWWNSIAGRFPSIRTDDAFVVMPNHIHGIIAIGHDAGCPQYGECSAAGGHERQGGRIGPPLHRVVQWYKTMTTNACIRGVRELGWPPFDKRLWQRNYYERIIRHDDELQHIREYIITNPLRWEKDQGNPESADGRGYAEGLGGG